MKEKIIIKEVKEKKDSPVIIRREVIMTDSDTTKKDEAKKAEIKKDRDVGFIERQRKTDYNTMKWYINFINPLIISTTFVVISNIKSFTMSLLVGFIVMLVLIYSLYEIIGRILKKKEFDKNV